MKKGDEGRHIPLSLFTKFTKREMRVGAPFYPPAQIKRNTRLYILSHCTSSSQQEPNLVPAGSPSCGGDVTVYVPDINQPSLLTAFYSVLVSVSVFLALSTVFHSINSPNNSPLSHSVLLALFCLIGPLNHISLYESLPQP